MALYKMLVDVDESSESTNISVVTIENEEVKRVPIEKIKDNFNKELISDIEENSQDIERLKTGKADITAVSSPYNFKGSTTYAALPMSGNTVNDTYYCTDAKCKYTWNGTAWYQSSLNEADYEEVFSQLSNEIDGLNNFIFAPNILINSNFKENKYWAGKEFDSDDYSYFEFNAISGTKYKFATNPRFIYIDNESVSASMENTWFSYTATNDGIIRVSFFNSDREKWAVCKNEFSIDEVGTYDKPILNDNLELPINKEPIVQSYSKEMYMALKKNYIITFYGTFDSFTSLSIGTRINSGTIMFRYVIDSTKVYFAYPNYSTWLEMPHGLTINNMIGVKIEMPWSGMCKITVTTESGVFESTMQNYCYQYEQYVPYADLTAVNGNGKLNATCKDFNKKIAIFGDSYLSQQDSRWLSHCEDRENALINAYPGQQTITGKNHLINLLNFCNPKYLIWLYGMNDGSDVDDIPSSEWLNGVNLVISLCKKNKITPIFGTIPNVPNISHKGKNKWIRESGYRYIDFANAVGSDENSNWYTGLLSEDNVHPTVRGAEVLASKFYNDFPEICIN